MQCINGNLLLNIWVVTRISMATDFMLQYDVSFREMYHAAGGDFYIITHVDLREEMQLPHKS